MVGVSYSYEFGEFLISAITNSLNLDIIMISCIAFMCTRFNKTFKCARPTRSVREFSQRFFKLYFFASAKNFFFVSVTMSTRVRLMNASSAQSRVAFEAKVSSILRWLAYIFDILSDFSSFYHAKNVKIDFSISFDASRRRHEYLGRSKFIELIFFSLQEFNSLQVCPVFVFSSSLFIFHVQFVVVWSLRRRRHFIFIIIWIFFVTCRCCPR